jgi:LDH2 family malate/lactate/ureidoglycolate dehydrogenase
LLAEQISMGHLVPTYATQCPIKDVIRLERTSKRSCHLNASIPPTREPKHGLAQNRTSAGGECGRGLGSLIEFLGTVLLDFSSFTVNWCDLLRRR